MSNNKDKGFVLLWRSIADNPLLDDGSPYDKFHAWCDLLCMVNHKDKKIIVNGNPVIVKRGEKLTSIVKLSERWHWSRCRTMRYLNALERDNMVSTLRTPNGTTVTVINYDFYNSMRTSNDTPNDTTHDTPNDTAVDTQTNNDKNNVKYMENKKTAPLINAWGEVVEE